MTPGGCGGDATATHEVVDRCVFWRENARGSPPGVDLGFLESLQINPRRDALAVGSRRDAPAIPCGVPGAIPAFRRIRADEVTPQGAGGYAEF